MDIVHLDRMSSQSVPKLLRDGFGVGLEADGWWPLRQPVSLPMDAAAPPSLTGYYVGGGGDLEGLQWGRSVMRCG